MPRVLVGDSASDDIDDIGAIFARFRGSFIGGAQKFLIRGEVVF